MFWKIALGTLKSCCLTLTSSNIRGHSTTTWTRFYPILTPLPPSSGQLWTLYMISTLCHMTKLLTPSPLFLSTQLLNDSSAFALVLGKPQHRKRFATSIRVGPSNRNWADHHCLQLVTKCLLRRKYYSLGARADWLVHSSRTVVCILVRIQPF